MTNCQEIQAAFDERLDERLDAVRRDAFEAHLARCASCRREWEAYAGAWQALARQQVRAPSFGFVERTVRQLDQAPAAAPSWWRRPVWRWAMAGAAALALGVSGWGVRQHRLDVRRAEIYAHVQHGDFLEDYDVIASLDRLDGGNQL